MSDAEIRWPNPQEVRRNARLEWERRESRKLGIQERIGQSVPWWLVAIALAFFALSAPHTSSTFDRLTPGWGWVSPIAVELSLLYAAFRRRQIAQANAEADEKDKKEVPSGLRWLEIFAFIVAILVNGAGSFIAVVTSNKGTSSLSTLQILSQFGSLPAQDQVSLALAPLSAFIIPIGTWVAGEGVAALILERRANGNLLDKMWMKVRIEIEFNALRDAAVTGGIPPGQAAKWAGAMVREVGSLQLSAGQSALPSNVGLLDAPLDSSGHPADMSSGHPVESASSPQHATGQGYTKSMDARERIRTAVHAHLDNGGTWESLDSKTLIPQLGVGRSTFFDEIAKMKEAAKAKALASVPEEHNV